MTEYNQLKDNKKDKSLIFGLTNLIINTTKEKQDETSLEESIKERE